MRRYLVGLRASKKNVDPSKRVEKYMDSQFAPGVDDALDIVVNPVLVHRIEQEKRRERERKLAKARSNMAMQGARSGGLARLGLTIADKPDAPGRKAKSLMNVESYLAGREGVNMIEDELQICREVGKKNTTVTQMARSGTAMPASCMKSTARQKSRAAMHASRQQFDVSGGTSSSGAGHSKSGSQNFTSIL